MIKIKEATKMIKDIVYKDNSLLITEHFVNGRQTGINVEYSGELKNIRVVFFTKEAFSKKEMKEFTYYREWLVKNSKTLKTLKDFNKYIPYLSDGSGEILFDINEVPVSLPLSFSYIGSLQEKNYNDEIYSELFRLLKKHPYIMSIEEGEIPYYNRDFSTQKGITQAKVYIPQDEYVELYNYSKEICKGKEKDFWSCKMHDIMRSSYNWYGYPLYGKEISDLLTKYYTMPTISEEINEEGE